MTHFSESLKVQRQELNLTMQALADRALVSKSMICKIERDEVQPTLDVAARLACALGKTLSEMLHSPQTTSVVYLPHDQQAVWEDANHIKRRNISPVFEGLKLEWLQVELPPHTSMPKCIGASAIGVEKYILVTEGSLELHINQEIFMMQPGDSIYFDCSCSHQYFNHHNERVICFVLVKY